MDSAFGLTTTTQMALFKALHRHVAAPPQCVPRALLQRRIKCVASCYYRYRSPSTTASFASSATSPSLTALCALASRTPCRLRCVSSSASSFAASSGGNGGGDGVNGGGGGGSGGESGDANPKLVAEGAQELSALSPDVIILDVAGMVCGGCAANVKRILESRPLVSSASVNLTTETAIVWPVSEAKTAPNWQKQLGEALAEHLTSCGFNSSLRGEEDSN